MIREFRDSIENSLHEVIALAARQYRSGTSLPVDLLETDEEFLAVFDAPGTRSEEVDVRFERDTLHLRVGRSREDHEGFELQVPGRPMTLSSTVSLPSDVPVDAEDADAILTDRGTLEVHIPKVSERPTGMRSDDGSTEPSVTEVDQNPEAPTDAH